MGQLAGDDAAAAGHRDRVARFGGECAAAARPGRGRGLLAAGRAGAGGDRAGDVTVILAPPGARRYGRAAAGGRAGRAVAAAGQGGPA